MTCHDFEYVVANMLENTPDREECEQRFNALCSEDISGVINGLVSLTNDPNNKTKIKTSLVLLQRVIKNAIKSPNYDCELIAPLIIDLLSNITEKEHIYNEYSSGVVEVIFSCFFILTDKWYNYQNFFLVLISSSNQNVKITGMLSYAKVVSANLVKLEDNLQIILQILMEYANTEEYIPEVIASVKLYQAIASGLNPNDDIHKIIIHHIRIIPVGALLSYLKTIYDLARNITIRSDIGVDLVGIFLELLCTDIPKQCQIYIYKVLYIMTRDGEKYFNEKNEEIIQVTVSILEQLNDEFYDASVGNLYEFAVAFLRDFYKFLNNTQIQSIFDIAMEHIQSESPKEVIAGLLLLISLIKKSKYYKNGAEDVMIKVLELATCEVPEIRYLCIRYLNRTLGNTVFNNYVSNVGEMMLTIISEDSIDENVNLAIKAFLKSLSYVPMQFVIENIETINILISVLIGGTEDQQVLGIRIIKELTVPLGKKYISYFENYIGVLEEALSSDGRVFLEAIDASSQILSIFPQLTDLAILLVSAAAGIDQNTSLSVDDILTVYNIAGIQGVKVIENQDVATHIASFGEFIFENARAYEAPHLDDENENLVRSPICIGDIGFCYSQDHIEIAKQSRRGLINFMKYYPDLFCEKTDGLIEIIKNGFKYLGISNIVYLTLDIMSKVIKKYSVEIGVFSELLKELNSLHFYFCLGELVSGLRMVMEKLAKKYGIDGFNVSLETYQHVYTIIGDPERAVGNFEFQHKAMKAVYQIAEIIGDLYNENDFTQLDEQFQIVMEQSEIYGGKIIYLIETAFKRKELAFFSEALNLCLSSIMNAQVPIQCTAGVRGLYSILTNIEIGETGYSEIAPVLYFVLFESQMTHINGAKQIAAMTLVHIAKRCETIVNDQLVDAVNQELPISLPIDNVETIYAELIDIVVDHLDLFNNEDTIQILVEVSDLCEENVKTRLESVLQSE